MFSGDRKTYAKYRGLTYEQANKEITKELANSREPFLENRPYNPLAVNLRNPIWQGPPPRTLKKKTISFGEPDFGTNALAGEGFTYQCVADDNATIGYVRDIFIAVSNQNVEALNAILSKKLACFILTLRVIRPIYNLRSERLHVTMH